MPPKALGLMSRRTIVVDSNIWKIYTAGRVTVYGKDEFGLVFELGTGSERKRACAFPSAAGETHPMDPVKVTAEE